MTGPSSTQAETRSLPKWKPAAEPAVRPGIAPAALAIMSSAELGLVPATGLNFGHLASLPSVVAAITGLPAANTVTALLSARCRPPSSTTF